MHHLKHSLFRAMLAGVVVSSTGCLAVDDTTETTTSQEIDGGVLASSWQARRAVAMPLTGSGPSCTGTVIAPDWILTAASCGPVACGGSGCQVHFYGDDPNVFSWPSGAQMISISAPPADGLLNDIALAKVDRYSVNRSTATMAWRYPGLDIAGAQVGAGNHGGIANPGGRLEQIGDPTDSSTDADGSFVTENADIDDGDIGGPFYVNGQVVGALHGSGGLLNDDSVYTSIPKRLGWILSAIGYRWSGAPPIGRKYDGAELTNFTAQSNAVCQYACERTSSCVAYNFRTTDNKCVLRSSVTGVVPEASTYGGLRYGESRASMTGIVAGYHRTDGFNVVVYKNSANLVREGALLPPWTAGTIQSTGGAPSVGAKLSPYRRTDGLNAVVYRSGSSLVELALTGAWVANTLPVVVTSSPVGDPSAYVRADGLSAVVYRTSTGGIGESLYLGVGTPNGWQATDLRSATGAPSADGDPTAYARSDGYSSVLYRSAGRVIELYRSASGGWAYGDLTSVAGCTDTVASNPHGYVHHDGTNAVVFRNTLNQIIEMYFDGSNWHCGALTGGTIVAAGEPYPYVRNDGTNAVVYRVGNAIYQTSLFNGAWSTISLTAQAGGGAAASDPVAYHRTDGFNAVVYKATNGTVWELVQTFGSGWSSGTLPSS